MDQQSEELIMSDVPQTPAQQAQNNAPVSDVDEVQIAMQRLAEAKARKAIADETRLIAAKTALLDRQAVEERALALQREEQRMIQERWAKKRADETSEEDRGRDRNGHSRDDQRHQELPRRHVALAGQHPGDQPGGRDHDRRGSGSCDRLRRSVLQRARVELVRPDPDSAQLSFLSAEVRPHLGGRGNQLRRRGKLPPARAESSRRGVTPVAGTAQSGVWLGMFGTGRRPPLSRTAFSARR